MTNMKRLGCLSAVALLGVALGGCYSGSDEGVSPEEETITVTSVEIKADGTQAVTTGTITRADQLEMHRRREINEHGEYPGLGTAQQASIIVASCSNGNAMWMYDGAGQTGNMLCLIVSGAADTVSLSSYPLGAGTWSGHVASYWTGVDSGFFFQGPVPWCQNVTANFTASDGKHNLFASTTHGIHMGDTICKPG